MSDNNAAVWARLRELEAGHNELSRQVVGHLSACDVRHQEIVRRQGESAQDRANLRAEMMSGFAGINAKFEAHNDSIANVEHLSLSGQKIMKHADRCLTQWEHLAAEGGPEYAGAVL